MNCGVRVCLRVSAKQSVLSKCTYINALAIKYFCNFLVMLNIYSSGHRNTARN